MPVYRFVEAMFKKKKLFKDSLDNSIKQASEKGAITKEMASWADQIRIVGNKSSHADTEDFSPTSEDARICVEFAKALAEYLFVLPARVLRGVESFKKDQDDQQSDR